MYTSINGIYEDGKFILLETPPTREKSRVIITFISEEKAESVKRRLGGLEGKVSIPDDFNDRLEDLEEYMS